MKETFAAIVALSVACAWQQHALQRLIVRVSALEAACSLSTADTRPVGQPIHAHSLATATRFDGSRPLAEMGLHHRRLATTDAPRATVRVDVEDDAGVSELVFGSDSSARRVSFEHDVSSFRLVRNTSAIVEADALGDTHVGSAAQTRVHGERLSFESRKVVPIVELDGVTQLWSPNFVEIYVGDTVTWAWSSLQNIAQADSNFEAIHTRPGAFFSGPLVVNGAFSLRFDTPGTFNYKSQNTASLTGTIIVKQFSWERGNLVLDGNVTINSAPLIESLGPAVKEVKMFLADNCPPGWEEVPEAAGYMLVSRPTGGASGTKLNTPFANNESNRVPPHGHSQPIYSSGTNPKSPSVIALSSVSWFSTSYYFGPTSTLPLNANALHFPQIYVLLCQAKKAQHE